MVKEREMIIFGLNPPEPSKSAWEEQVSVSFQHQTAIIVNNYIQMYNLYYIQPPPILCPSWDFSAFLLSSPVHGRESSPARVAFDINCVYVAPPVCTVGGGGCAIRVSSYSW